MEERNKENATNENINSQADTLIDLAIPDEQADETKGGNRPFKPYIAPGDPS